MPPITYSIIAYLIEYIFLLFFSLIAIFISVFITCLIFTKSVLKNKKEFIKLIIITTLIILIINTIGWVVWNIAIEDKIIEEADPWITSLPYSAISWKTTFIFDYEKFSIEERMENLWYKPLPPLKNLTQVSIFSHIFSILQISIAYLLSMFYVFKKYKENSYYLFISLIFLLQIFFLGFTTLLNNFI